MTPLEAAGMFFFESFLMFFLSALFAMVNVELRSPSSSTFESVSSR